VIVVQVSKSIPLLVAVALMLGGCAGAPEPTAVLFQVPTQQPPPPGGAVCMDALNSGTLVADARWGIALGEGDAPTLQVMWPTGYVGRRTADGAVELLDENGVVVGRVGDKVTIGGGHTGDAWWACGAPNHVP
jgi:hypothetical protein